MSPVKTPPTEKKDAPEGVTEHKQRRLFKKTRAGQVLSREEVKAIKLGRKKLRKEMRAAGIKSKKEFELTASSLGLYFDKNKKFGLLLWFFHGRGLAALLSALAALMVLLFAFSLVSQMQGHFTINMSDGMFREGFSLSDSIGFENPTMRLFCEAAENVPCFSISDIHSDVNDVDGQHNEAQYFAYTFYIRNEGESTVDYSWQMELSSESHDLSKATWVMLFENDEMLFYAEAREDGTQEALPYFDDDSRGYLSCPFEDHAADPETQFQLITTSGSRSYYRLIPYAFESEDIVGSGGQTEVEPMEVNKYTVVIWLEGDDPDCTDELIGGHLGLEMNFRLIEEEGDQNTDTSFVAKWKMFWDNLVFWD